jgi:hypothetical protein
MEHQFTLKNKVLQTDQNMLITLFKLKGCFKIFFLLSPFPKVEKWGRGISKNNLEINGSKP